MSSSLDVQRVLDGKDKKQLPPSPTLMYAEPWPSDDDDDDDEKGERNDNKGEVGGKI